VPATVVMGMVADSLFDPPPLRADKPVGNNVIHLTWTRPEDLDRELPGFPAGGIATWDAAFRFLWARATPIGQYQSLIWGRVQQLDHRLRGEVLASNRFGATEDMARLGAQLQRGAPERLRAALATSGPLYGRWFSDLRELAARAGAPVVVVELPMRKWFREAVTDLPEAAQYRQALEARLRATGAAYLDFSHWAGATDQAFVDDLHLGPAGAAEFSQALGEALAAVHGAAFPNVPAK